MGLIVTTEHYELLAPTFTSLAQALRTNQDPSGIYQAIVDAAVSSISGCDHASVMLLSGGSFKTAAYSDPVGLQLENLELECGEGPCLDAVLEEGYQHDPDISINPTWPRLAERCLGETPVRSMMGFRLIHDGRKSGALNVFADRPGALTEESAQEAAVLAAFAAVAIMAAEQQDRARNLEVSLTTNREIGKAIGLLMAAHNLSDDEAFDVLRRASQSLNRKLHDIAVEYVGKHMTQAS